MARRSLSKLLCEVAGCDKHVDARAMCSSHYRRWMRHGDPTGGTTRNGDPLRYLRDVVLTHVGSECLPWPYACNQKGYPRIYIEGKQKAVTRVICTKVYGPPPTEEHEAAHSCGKGHEKCVTPGHLSWKTPQENAADKIGHNTAQVGERHSRAKLTDANIREIRAAPSSDGLAARFGVAKVTIRHIRSGRKWRHV